MAGTRGREKPVARRSKTLEHVLVTAVFVFVVPILLVVRSGDGAFYPNFYLFLVIVAALITAVVWLLIWLRSVVRRRRTARRAQIGIGASDDH